MTDVIIASSLVLLKLVIVWQGQIAKEYLRKTV